MSKVKRIHLEPSPFGRKIIMTLATEGPLNFRQVHATLCKSRHLRESSRIDRDLFRTTWKRLRSAGHFIKHGEGKYTPRYPDSKGLGIDDYHQLIPGRIGEQKIGKIKSREALQEYADANWRCLICGAVNRLEIHHIIGGYGRSDELTNLLMLCSDCHGTSRYSGAPPPLGKCLFAKWWYQQMQVDWARLAVLRARHLPDLDPPYVIERKYRESRYADRCLE